MTPTTTMHTTTATTAISRIGATSFSMRRTSMASAVSNNRVGRKMTRNAWDEMWKLDSEFRKSVHHEPGRHVAAGRDQQPERAARQRQQHGIGQPDPLRQRRQQAGQRQQPGQPENDKSDISHGSKLAGR